MALQPFILGELRQRGIQLPTRFLAARSSARLRMTLLGLPGVPVVFAAKQRIWLGWTSRSRGRSPPPSSELRFGYGARPLCIAQSGLQIAMAEALATGAEADTSVDELQRPITCLA